MTAARRPADRFSGCLALLSAIFLRMAKFWNHWLCTPINKKEGALKPQNDRSPVRSYAERGFYSPDQLQTAEFILIFFLVSVPLIQDFFVKNQAHKKAGKALLCRQQKNR